MISDGIVITNYYIVILNIYNCKYFKFLYLKECRQLVLYMLKYDLLVVTLLYKYVLFCRY